MSEYADYAIDREIERLCGGDRIGGRGTRERSDRRKSGPAQVRKARDLAQANEMFLWPMGEGHFVLSFTCQSVAVEMSLWPEQQKKQYSKQPRFLERMKLKPDWNIYDAVRSVVMAAVPKELRKWVD